MRLTRVQGSSTPEPPGACHLNVLFMHHGDPHVRGSEIALVNALDGLRMRGINPILLCNQSVMAEAVYRRTKIRPLLTDTPRAMWEGNTLELNVVGLFKILRTLVKVIRASKIDVVYCNGGRTAQVAYYAAQLTGVPIIGHIHCSYDKRYILLYRLAKLRHLIFVSRYTQTQFMSKVRVKNGTSVVYNGVDTSVFRPAARRRTAFRRILRIATDAVVVGQVSSMTFAKGVDILLRAFKVVSQVHGKTHLVLVGDGRDIDQLRTLSSQLGLKDRVCFLGERKKTWHYYRHVFDINVLASRQDALGLALVEGASCGLPSVAPGVGGMPEVVRNGVSGLLFSDGDHLSLAKQLGALIENFRLRQELGIKAREIAEQEFSLACYVTHLEKIIRQCVLQK